MLKDTEILTANQKKKEEVLKDTEKFTANQKESIRKKESKNRKRQLEMNQEDGHTPNDLQSVAETKDRKKEECVSNLS
jgi:hypothetical protein